MADTLSKSASDQLVAEIRDLGQTQGLNAVFTTFLELMATSLAAILDPLNQEERNARHDEIVSGLPPEVVSSYARMCALMALAVREHVDGPCDILGKIYHELRLNNEWNGQFFSPDDICRMMAMIVNPVDDKHIKENGYVTINDPTCGSGAMLIGSIWAMKQRGIDFKKECLLVGQDIDIRCVWMAYIQLCLYEIPAIVIHANTLTMEEWSYWYTPYSLQLITKRRTHMNNTLVIVVKKGMVQEVYSLNPCQTEIEIIDLDCNGSDPNAEYEATERLKAVRQCLYKLY